MTITILVAAFFTVLAIAYGIEAIRDANENLKRLTELRQELFHPQSEPPEEEV